MLSIEFLALAWLAASILTCIGVATLRKSFRISGFVSWLLLFLLAGAPTCAAVLALQYIPTPAGIRVPTAAGLAILLGAWWIHGLVPRIVPDFQTTQLASSLLIALIQGASIMGVHYYMFPTY